MNEFIAACGRLHPLLLHLPIGLIAGLGAVELIGFLQRSPAPQLVVRTLALFTQLTAAAAVLTGLVLVREGGYPDELATNHRNLGLAFLIVCVVVARLARREQSRTAFRCALGVALALVVATGHLGGSITHGSGFVLAPFERAADSSRPAVATNEPTAVEALEPATPRYTFAEHVAPLIESTCVECHGERKRKGRLTMHTREGLERGGSTGPVLRAGNASESALLVRMRLPLDDEEHMPPADKPQPSAEQIAFLDAWIVAGAPFDESFESQVTPPPVRAAPRTEFADEDTSTATDETSAVSAEPQAPSTVAMDALRTRLVHVQPLSQTDSLLWIDFAAPAADIDDRAAMELLTPLLAHVAELSLARTQISDLTLGLLANATQLRKLDLRATAVSDAGLSSLDSAPELRELNVSQTSIGDGAIEALVALPKLERLVLWRSAISAEGRARLHAAKPSLVLEDGNAPPASALEAEGEVKFTSDAPLPGAAAVPTALTPINATCPVSGSPVNPKYAVVFEGKIVGFCCPNCPKEFWADPPSFAEKLK